MPYKKRYPRRRRSKFTKYMGYASTTANVASRALTTAMALKRLLNVEYKFLDAQTQLTAIPNTGLNLDLTNSSQGDTDQTRDGNSIKVVALYGKMLFTQHANATSTFVRVVLVHDKQTNQANFSDADLFTDSTALDIIVSALNIDNKYRFHVLLDVTIALSAAGNTAKTLKFYKKLNMPIRYDANAGDITDITSNSLTLVFFGSEATNTPSVTSFIRTRYVDN